MEGESSVGLSLSTWPQVLTCHYFPHHRFPGEAPLEAHREVSHLSHSTLRKQREVEAQGLGLLVQSCFHCTMLHLVALNGHFNTYIGKNLPGKLCINFSVAVSLKIFFLFKKMF